jgi:hypothetical protein
MTNSDDGMDLINEIIRSIDITYNWNIYKPVEKTVVTLIPSKLATFAGTYLMNQLNLTLLITIEGNNLLVKQLWDEQVFFLYPESNLDFFIKENGYSIKFESTPDGTITGLILLQEKWTKIK